MTIQFATPSRSIVTTYNGTRFRSRLEARWAAFFDLLKWPWQYEPIDLEFYIPDFVLMFDAGLVAVEVKPELLFKDLKDHAQRIVFSGWKKELIAVGATLFQGGVIGINGEPIEDGETSLGEAQLFTCLSCGGFSFLNASHGWRCRACGCVEGHVGHVAQEEINTIWNSAGNRVQWKAEM